MSTPRSVLLLPLALLAAAACSSGGNPDFASKTGAELYGTYCASCHGADGRGTMFNLGPSMSGVRAYWDEGELLEYIGDPQAYAAKDERLGKREMAAISDDVPTDARKRLVEHALSLMD